ncbi:MAG: glycosyltransferase, partial [Chloroflexi bacterium]|nr:glycosyltransferase [Chloroflexota bacterium]
MPTVSVIIPTYNRAQLAREAVESVLAQTYQDFEIIVVDDGSTDDTAEVLAAYSDRIRYIRQDNSGVSAARNHGMRLARGSYIAFLDSDDLFLPNKLAVQVSYFEDHPNVAMTYTAYISVDENLQPLNTHPAREYPGGHKEMLIACTIATPTVMFRRSILDALEPFDEHMHLAEDIDLWVRIATRYAFATIQEPLTYVRIHSGGTPRDPEEILNAYMYLFEKSFKGNRAYSWPYKRRAYARMHYICAADILSRIDPNSTDPNKNQTYYYYFWKAVRYWPFSRTALHAISNRMRERGRRIVSLPRRAANRLLLSREKVLDSLQFGDLDKIAFWMSRHLEWDEVYPILESYGFHPDPDKAKAEFIAKLTAADLEPVAARMAHDFDA